MPGFVVTHRDRSLLTIVSWLKCAVILLRAGVPRSQAHRNCGDWRPRISPDAAPGVPLPVVQATRGHPTGGGPGAPGGEEKKCVVAMVESFAE
jgi:hypothetical protein